jgi:tripartite ATP-independent transporter DctM subunit
MLLGMSLFVLVFALMIMGVPVYIALGAAGTVGLLMLKGNPLLVVPQSLYAGIGFFPLLAIPFFILAGELMNRGGITDRLISFSRMLIGKAPASLANSNILASMFFGGVTGSAQADTSAIGGVLIPAMVKEGYSPEFSVAVTASSSTCGPIIPPSIMMVIYCVTVGGSVGTMFVGGIIPGILIGLGLICVVLIMDRKYHFPRLLESMPVKEKLRVTVEAIWPLGMPLIIVGGILGGVVTPTEAGALAVLYSLIVGFWIMKTLSLKDLVSMLKNTALLTSTVLMIISCARILGWVLTAVQIQVYLGELFKAISDSPYIFLFLVNILLLIMGTFMDGGASVIILAPILTPIAISLGINPIHFGLLMVLNLVIGCGTPPLGLCLFIACGIAKIPVEKGAKAIMPFLVAEIVVLFLVTYIPEIVLFIPRALGYL